MSGAIAAVEVYWRPGCPFCGSLRRGLRRAGVATQEVNIWGDPAAAARVREATGGDETVPTVFVGGRALVAPRARDVVAILERDAPNLLAQPGSLSPSASRSLLRRLGLSRRVR